MDVVDAEFAAGRTAKGQVEVSGGVKMSCLRFRSSGAWRIAVYICWWTPMHAVVFVVFEAVVYPVAAHCQLSYKPR